MNTPTSSSINDSTEVTGPTFELLVSSDSSSTSGRGLEHLQAGLVSSSIQLMKFSSYYIDGEARSFDWSGFKTAVDAYTSNHSDLAVVKAASTSFHQTDASVSEMVDKIVSWLIDTFNVTVPVDKNALAATVYDVFVNLKSAKFNGFADFKSSSSSKSSYVYRLTVIYPHPSDVNKSYFLVATITLGANITEEKSWWGLTTSVKKDFSADIDGLQLEVTKGFVNPL